MSPELHEEEIEFTILDILESTGCILMLPCEEQEFTTFGVDIAGVVHAHPN